MHIEPAQMRLYAVTDNTWLNGRTLAGQVRAALEGGATFVQLREKGVSPAQLLADAREIGALCRAYGVPFVVNDSVEAARAAGADGVHVGQQDMAAGSARALLGPDRIRGVTAHNVAEALRAEAAGADYLGVGAAFVTHTKANTTPITPAEIRAITAAVHIPVVAIGGITAENVLALAGCGLAGVAVVSALFAQPDVKAAAAQMRALADRL